MATSDPARQIGRQTPTTRPGLGNPRISAVLVHGGMHASWWWERITPRLTTSATAIDLPGRDGAGPRPVTLSGWANSVADAVRLESGRALLVAHSLGGFAALAALPEVADRVAGILLAAATVPEPGQSYWNMLPSAVRCAQRAWYHGRSGILMPRFFSKIMLCHDLSRTDTERLLDRMVPEPASVLSSPVNYHIPENIDVTYVRTSRDRMIPPALQRRYVATLPERTHLFEVNCGHSIAYARPDEFSSIIDATARRLRC